MVTPNRWTEIAWNLQERCFIVTLYVAPVRRDALGFEDHAPAVAADRARAHTNAQAEALGAAMLKGAHAP